MPTGEHPNSSPVAGLVRGDDFGQFDQGYMPEFGDFDGWIAHHHHVCLRIIALNEGDMFDIACTEQCSAVVADDDIFIAGQKTD